MKKVLATILRLLALVVIYVVLFTTESRLTTPAQLAQQFTPAQMQQAAAALPAVSLIMTLMLAYLALRSRWWGWKLAGALFAIFYVIYTFLSWIELLAFPAVSRQMPPGMLSGMLLGGLILGIPFSLLAVWILGKTRRDPAADQPNERLIMSAPEWLWRAVCAALLYDIVYFTFGYFVAWRTPGLPAFYGGTDPGTFLGQLANVARQTPWLYGVAFLRGLLWTAAGCLIIRMHRGAAWETVLATGLSFTVLMNASLLFPNPFFPPAVLHAHTIELVSSNFLYGLLLAAFLLWRPRPAVRAPAPA